MNEKDLKLKYLHIYKGRHIVLFIWKPGVFCVQMFCLSNDNNSPLFRLYAAKILKTCLLNLAPKFIRIFCLFCQFCTHNTQVLYQVSITQEKLKSEIMLLCMWTTYTGNRYELNYTIVYQKCSFSICFLSDK